MVTKQIAPTVLKPLKDALAKVYWFKADLKDFLVSVVPLHTITGGIDISRSKREFSSDVVMALYENQHKYFDELLNLTLAVADVQDPGWLKELEDGELKYSEAVGALETLRRQIEPYRVFRTEAEQIRVRAEQQRNVAERHREHSEALAELRHQFEEMEGLDRQRRGYELEKFLPKLFLLFDIEARGSFRISGEQIDGAFNLNGTNYIVEAKWQATLTPGSDISAFRSKVDGKLESTLGLFLSMSGFEPSAVEKLNGLDRPNILLMNGFDLMAVLQDRVSLPVMITRKNQHAGQTGEVYLSAWEIG